MDGPRFDGTASALNAGDNIYVKTFTEGESIGLGDGTGTLELTATELSYFNPTNRLIIGDSVAGTGAVDIDGVDIFANVIDVYGGDITLANLSNVDGSTSTFTARTGDLTLFDDLADSSVILDEIKANFTTLAGDLILAPETATNSIGINSAADFQFNNVDLSGFTNVAKNLILGDPTNGAGVVTIGALNFAALSPNTGIGFYGSNIAINGDIQSGGDILLGADGIAFNNFDLIADDDVIITTQNTALDIGVSGGTLGPIDITDAVIDDIFAGNDGTGNLIIGEAETGTGTIDIDGLDLTGAGYGLKLYGSTIDLNDASITTDADLTLGADTLTNFTTAVNANGVIEVAPQTAVLLDIDEPSNEFTLNGDTFSLALLNQGANLILGSSRGGDVTWTSATHDFAAIDARSGGNITLINTNAGTSYGLGDGTTGDVFYSTAQLEAINAGGTLILGNKISGTGVIDIADLSGADLGYGLDIAGGNIDIGGWNGDVGDLTLLARTGDITSTEGGLITGGLLNLNAAGNIGTAANRLNTSVNQIDYITGGDVYITEANAVTLNSGIQNGAGTVEIATLDGELSLPNALTFTGDVLLESGGENDLFVTQDLIFNATNEATLNLRAGRDLAILSTVSAIENTNGQALNVILNSDRNQNQNGAVFVDRVDINTNDGDLTIGGGLNPETTVAYGSVGTPYNDGVYLNSAVTTGAGNISIRGHGANGGRDNLGVGLIAATSLTTTTGDIYVNGEGGDGTFNNFGLSSGQNSAIVTESGSIDLIGRGGNGRSSSVTSGNNAYGLFIQNASRVTSTGVGPSVGDITITGTAGDQSYNAYGVRTDNTDITANSANINITGQGSNTIANDTNRGVFIRTGSVIRSTGTGDDAGEITIIGTGGTGQSGNDGVFLDDLGTLITSVEGDILITGQGGGNGQTDSNANHGVEIVSARIQSTGTGSNAATITIDGTAGLGEDSNQGVRISDAGGSVTAIDGDINITGYGGSNGQAESGSNYGVVVSNGGNITSTGTGENSSEITINGTGGIGNNTNYGVFVGGVGTFVTSLDGDINITGQGGSIGATNSNSNAGIRIDGGGIVSSGTGANAAKIILTGTGGAGEDSNHGITLDDNGTSLTSVDGDIILMGQGASNGQTEGISNYGVAVTDTSIIRSTGLGESAAKIIIDGIGGNGEDTNHGVFIASSTIESARADITLSGVGGTNGQTGSDANRGVVINNSVIESTNTFDDLNTITIDGIGGEGGNTNMGIDILSGAQIISNTNDIVINGIAKGNENISGDSNYGILLRSASEIISNGTGADAAKVTLNGTGGNGDDGNVGVLISNVGTEVQSVNGDISIVGVGGSNSRDGSNSNYGTSVVGGAVIKSTGTGDNAANIMFDGTGGQGQGGNYGFNATGLGTSIVTVDGDIDILGQGGVRGFESASAYGARIADTLVESTGNGDLNLTGVGGLSSTSSNFGLLLSDATEVKAAQGDIVLKGTDTSLGNNGVRIEDDLVISALGIDGDITFITDRFNTTDNPTITAGDTITIAPETSGQSIGVGGGSGYLNIVDTELGNLSAARIVFGQQGVNASSININTTTVNGGTDIEFYGDDVNISGNINGANNIFIQGTSITKTGVDLTSTGDITFSTDDLTITNAVRAGDNFYVRALDLDGTIGIGDATGQDLNLTAADFAFFDAVAGRVNVGSDDNTGTVFVDNFDITGETYDFGLYGGAIDIQNGLSVGGELLARATTGNIGVFDGQVNAFGQSVFDVQQGGFKTNQGTNIWNVTGGNYILYTDNVFNSDIASLEPLADFINGQNSISLPPATIGTVTDTVVLRQDLDTAIGSIAAPDLIADIQAPSQQANNLTPNDEVSANALPTLDSHIESPYLTQKPNPNTKISKAKLSGSAGELKTKLKASVNSKGVKGIGITNAECDVNNAKNIVCNQSGSASR